MAMPLGNIWDGRLRTLRVRFLLESLCTGLGGDLEGEAEG